MKTRGLKGLVEQIGWGTWFSFEDKELERLYIAYLLDRALSGLTANIKSLWHIESTFLSGLSTLRTYVAWRSGERPGQFEHLMTDILNEEALVARSAPLAEDMLEKTDLRVSYPGVKARNGTRVQVSLTSNPVWHERKVEALLVPEEFIVLTPLELARTAVHPPSHRLLSDFNWEDFWRAFGGRQTVHDLALKIHALFSDALSFPPRHPLGPMWHVAPTLRHFIRIYAQHRAEKVVNSKTERARAKYLIDVSHIYSGAYWKQKFSQTNAEPDTDE